MTFKCEYCEKEYKREKSFIKHKCVKKDRLSIKNTRKFRLGHKLFNDWNIAVMMGTKPKTYKEFISSRYYGMFMKLSVYSIETNVSQPEQYLHWLIVKRIKIHEWPTDEVYTKYLIESLKKETPETALERYVKHAQKWSEEQQGRQWNEYWEKVTIFRMVDDVTMGRISPWILLGHPPAYKRIKELPWEMLVSISQMVDFIYWRNKIYTNESSVKWINEMITS